MITRPRSSAESGRAPFTKMSRRKLRSAQKSRDRDLGPGELIVVPRGTEHCPLALTDEVQVVLLEPKTTVNTGDAGGERTAGDQWV